MRRFRQMSPTALALTVGLTMVALPFDALASERPGADEPGAVTLTIRPKVPGKPVLSLLPPDKDRSEGNGAELYEVAADTISGMSGEPLSGAWITGPVSRLAREEAVEILQKAEPSLAKLKQAARCRKCKWDGPPTMQRLADYRQLARFLTLQVRLAIVEKRYDDAVHGLQTGLALARDLADGTELFHGLVSVAIGELMVEQLGEMIGSPGGPNLHAALADLPSPLVDLNPAIQRDLANLKKQNPLVRGTLQAQLKPSHDKARLLALRLERRIAALRTIEAIRWYAATHNGKLPKMLNDIKEAPVPNDPATNKPFEYETTAEDRATLVGPAPTGGASADAIRYELRLDTATND